MTPQKSLAEYLPTIEELPAALARIDNADTLLADESMVVPTELIKGSPAQRFESSDRRILESLQNVEPAGRGDFCLDRGPLAQPQAPTGKV